MAKLKFALAALLAAAAVLVPVQLTAQAAPQAPAAAARAVSPNADGGSPTAAELLAKTTKCTVVSKSTYTNTQANKKVNICGATGAFFWTSGMNIDCDGQRTTQCNENTDCCYQNDTSFHLANGKPLSAAVTPYVVIPLPSSARWSYTSAGIKGGDILAVIYKNQVSTRSSATRARTASSARLLRDGQGAGDHPDPKNGGTADPVTYIVFKGSKSGAIDDHNATVTAVARRRRRSSARTEHARRRGLFTGPRLCAGDDRARTTATATGQPCRSGVSANIRHSLHVSDWGACRGDRRGGREAQLGELARA